MYERRCVRAPACDPYTATRHQKSGSINLVSGACASRKKAEKRLEWTFFFSRTPGDRDAIRKQFHFMSFKENVIKITKRRKRVAHFSRLSHVKGRPINIASVSGVSWVGDKRRSEGRTKMEKHLDSPWRHLTSDFFSNFNAVPLPSCISLALRLEANNTKQ